jgi:cell division protein FtsL
LRLVEGEPRRRVSRAHPAVVTVVMIVALVAAAVAFEAQQVAGQSHLDHSRAGIAEAHETQQELRARVAEAESPARVLEAAGELGMIEPAPVVAVPAPGAPLPASGEGVSG